MEQQGQFTEKVLWAAVQDKGRGYSTYLDMDQTEFCGKGRSLLIVTKVDKKVLAIRRPLDMCDRTREL